MRVSADEISLQMDLPEYVPSYFAWANPQWMTNEVPPQALQSCRKFSLTVSDQEMEAVKMLCDMFAQRRESLAQREGLDVEEEEEEEEWEEPSEIDFDHLEDPYVEFPKTIPERIKKRAANNNSPGQHAGWKTDILKKWFLEHADTSQGPYPTTEDKETLCQQTDLSMKQLDTWFSNNRRSDRSMWTREARTSHKRRKIVKK